MAILDASCTYVSHLLQFLYSHGVSMVMQNRGLCFMHIAWACVRVVAGLKRMLQRLKNIQTRQSCRKCTHDPFHLQLYTACKCLHTKCGEVAITFTRAYTHISFFADVFGGCPRSCFVHRTTQPGLCYSKSDSPPRTRFALQVFQHYHMSSHARLTYNRLKAINYTARSLRVQ